ncbi:MAG TPA: hypothetical protein VFP05_08490 [Thermomicrobiales bacterium]|nr:hypothetical protein [Thermomicrobiales bacterium]
MDKRRLIRKRTFHCLPEQFEKALDGEISHALQIVIRGIPNTRVEHDLAAEIEQIQQGIDGTSM